MVDLTVSGTLSDLVSGITILASQGRDGYQFIEGKRVLFRFLNLTQAVVADLDHVEITVDNGSKVLGPVVVPSIAILSDSDPNNPSIGFVVNGTAFSQYGIHAFLVNLFFKHNPPQEIVIHITFVETRDLRILVVFEEDSKNKIKANPQWTEDVQTSMLFLGAILPIRDGVKNQFATNVNSIPVCAGLRFQIANYTVDASVNAINRALIQTQAQDAQPNDDHIDVTVLYQRGSSPTLDVFGAGNFRFSQLSTGKLTGLTMPLMAESVGGSFNIFFQGQAMLPADGDAFDFPRLARFTDYHAAFVGNVMNTSVLPTGGIGQGQDGVQFSALDWNTLAQNFTKQITDNPTWPEKPGLVVDGRYACQALTFYLGENIPLPYVLGVIPPSQLLAPPYYYYRAGFPFPPPPPPPLGPEFGSDESGSSAVSGASASLSAQSNRLTVSSMTAVSGNDWRSLSAFERTWFCSGASEQPWVISHLDAELVVRWQGKRQRYGRRTIDNVRVPACKDSALKGVKWSNLLVGCLRGFS